MIYRIENANGENLFDKTQIKLRGFNSYQFADSKISEFNLCGFKDITILKQAISETMFAEIVKMGYKVYEVHTNCVSVIAYQSFYNNLDVIYKKDITNKLYKV